MHDPQTATPMLSARGLRFARNDNPVFGPLDFAVEGGEALLVRGGNGSGKTTLLRVLAGLLRADEGTIEIDGEPVRPQLRARIMAYLGHLPGLKADLSVLENLDFLCGLHGRRRGQASETALALVGLVFGEQLDDGDVDVAIWVRPEERKKGFGLHSLKESRRELAAFFPGKHVIVRAPMPGRK